MKTNLTNALNKIKIALILLALICTAKFGAAQTCEEKHDAPACNLEGPLTACLDNGNFVIKTTIQISGGKSDSLVYSFPTNTSGSFIVDTNFVSYNATDSTYVENVIVNPGTQSGSFNLELNVYVRYPDGCVMTCECSKSVTIVDIEATVSHTPIECAGGTSTMTVVGSGGSSFTYTILPGGPSNSTGIFAGLTAGTYSINVAGTKSGITCDTTVVDIITVNNNSPVVLHCANDTTVSSCLTTQQVAAAFQAWLNRFSHSGGKNPVFVRTPASPTAPSACGGSITVIDSVYSDCEGPKTCSSTFTVPAAPALSLNCPADQTIQGSGGGPGEEGPCVDLGGGSPATAPDLPSRKPKPSNVSVDFRQPRNADHPTDPLYWTNGCLNRTQSDYFEGMGVPQRIIFNGLVGTQHTLIMRHEAVKHQSGDVHAYDFLMSWEQAIATAQNIGNGSVNELSELFEQGCDKGISSQAGATCNDLSSFSSADPRVAYASPTDDMGNPPNHHGITNVNDAIACFEQIYGDRKIEIRGNAPITNFSIVFQGYDGRDKGDNYAWYSISWTSASSEVMIRLAGRAAASGNCGYGSCFGAGSISGAPYHFKLDLLDDASLGNRDNQVMVDKVSDTCNVEIPVTFGHPTIQGGCNNNSVVAVIDSDAVSYDTSGAKIHCRTWNVTDTVCGGSSQCTQCITVTCPSLRESGNSSYESIMFSAFPNPFNSRTTIQFKFDTNKPNVTVDIYSLSGEKIASLFNAGALAGTTYNVALDANKLAEGIYMYRISAGDKFYYGKLILMK